MFWSLQGWRFCNHSGHLFQCCSTLTVLCKPGLYLCIGEEHSHQEIRGPVGTTSHCHGCRPWALAEEFCHDEPGDRARANLKESHKAKSGNDADVSDPLHSVLQENKTWSAAIWGKHGTAQYHLPCHNFLSCTVNTVTQVSAVRKLCSLPHTQL